jgi:hypothetical protein
MVNEESNKITARPIARIITDRIGDPYIIEIQVVKADTQDYFTTKLSVSKQ